MAKATLGGVPLLASSPIKWRMTEGVRPATGVFDVSPGGATALIAQGQNPLDLVITHSFGRQETFKGLYVINSVPGDNPFINRVQVVDQRFWWTYPHIGPMRFNIRRTIGYLRRSQWNSLRLDPITEKVWFAKYSLYPPNADQGKPWKAKQIITEVWGGSQSKSKDGLRDKLAKSGIEIGKLNIDPHFKQPLQNMKVEDLTVDDDGHVAIGRVLSLIPGATVTVDADGEARVYSKADGFDEDQVSRLGPEIEGGGHVMKVMNSLIRPREVHVLFTIESEVRFDFLETQGNQNTVVEGGNINKREADNVLPNPDAFVDIKGERITQGVWKTLNEFLSVWTDTIGNVPPPTLDQWHSLLQKAFLPENDLWAAMLISGINDAASGSIFQNWSARISAIQTHYRRTFRINPNWMDRILAIKPFLISTVDPTSGTRAPAVAFSDYAYKPTIKALLQHSKLSQKLPYAWNVSGYPSGPPLGGQTVNSVTTDDRPSPSSVRVLDPDQGIITSSVKVDPFNEREIYFPSKLENTPTPDLRKQKFIPISFDSIARGKRPKLAESAKIAFFLTAVPAAPNDSRQLYRVKVKPGNIKAILPQSAQSGLEDAKGPIQEVRVGAGLETAKVKWDDSKAMEIEKIFGVRKGKPNLKDLVLNDKPQASVTDGAASLRVIAHAVAAQVYSGIMDRVQGDKTGRMTSAAEMHGNMSSLQHTMGTDGVATTSVELPEAPAPMPIEAFLPESVRKILFREVFPEKGGGGG